MQGRVRVYAMKGYKKYLCVLHKEIHIDDTEVTELAKMVNDGVRLTLGDKTLSVFSLSGVFHDIENIIKVMSYDTEEVLGIVEAHSESEAKIISNSKFHDIIHSSVQYLYDSWVEITDIDDITY